MVFLYLNSNRMGEGDPELGQKLLAGFLNELAKSDIKIDAIGCVNSAVFLTTEKNDPLESLKILEKNGSRIVSCGTCLDHFSRRDKLLIGEICSMDKTVQIMATADRVIKPC